MKYFYGILSFFILLNLLPGCRGTSYLQKDEKLLYKQSFEGVKGLNKEELADQLATTTNRRWPIVNWSYYVTFYHIGEHYYKPEKALERKQKVIEKYDEKIAKHSGRRKTKLIAKKNKKIAKAERLYKDGNFFMRWGEEVKVYDSLMEVRSVKNLENYLGTIGYFNASVDFKTRIDGKKAKVTYLIDKRKGYVVDSIQYNIPDQQLKALVLDRRRGSFITKGKVYQQENITAERNRLTKLLNNEGYFTFNKQFITFQVDTASLAHQRVIVQLSIANPDNQDQHKQYTIDSVVFITNSVERKASPIVQKEGYNGVTYVHGKRRFSPKILDWRLFLYPDSLYRKDDYLETQRQLSNLDMFKFVNVRTDTTSGRFITHVITSPLKKYQTSNEIGANVNGGLPGPFFNISLKNRNSFRALEVLELSGKLGAEGVGGATNADNTYSSIEYGGALSQTFPQFLFPLSNESRSKLGKFNPTTKLSVGLNFVERIEYDRNNLFGSVTYLWQKGKEKTFTLTPLSVNFIESELTPAFDSILMVLDRGNDRLINSFDSSFVTSASFSKTINKNSYGNRKIKSSFTKYDFESGGTLLALLGPEPVGPGFTYFQYLRFIADLRAAIPINKRRMTVYRISAGAAYAYGESETLPYEKFLFAGGSNSIRAWKPRRLGPGSFQQLDGDGNLIDDFEQPASLLLEANIESRFKMFSVFEGAFFLDMGNSWLLNKNVNKPNGEFEFSRFLSEIAIGTGFGLRLDFSLLVLRFDLGVKVHDPSRDPKDRFIWSSGFMKERYRALSPLVLNIGIGYPF